jgi:hypothetical protein
MGRELKRVPLDFKWPLHMPWKGYLNPYDSQRCKSCDGSGSNQQTKQLYDDWYDFANTGRQWCYDLTEHEIAALIKSGRLYDFTHDWNGCEWIPKEPPCIPTPAQVNTWARGAFGHDYINQWICVKARARRLGYYGKCEYCNGEGVIYFNDKIKQLSEQWHDKERYHPPIGASYQVWETVSEGSPISPVFATKDELVTWLISEGYSETAARSFIESEWVPSMIIQYSDQGTTITSNIECAELIPKGE